MSFIDLMKSYIWSDADIVNRTEAMISAEFPKQKFDILMRKVQGTQFGYVLTDQEKAEFQNYKAIAYHAGTEAAAARADMALLHAVLRYEEAVRRLALPPTTEDPMMLSRDETGAEIIVDNPVYIADRDERAASQAVVSSASQEVLDLYQLRNPPDLTVEPTP